MLVDELVDVLAVHVGVPDRVGVDHHDRALLAAVEASRLVDAHLAGPGELQALDAILGVVAHFLRAAAVAALLAFLALVAAEENVLAIVAHGRNYIRPGCGAVSAAATPRRRGDIRRRSAATARRGPARSRRS